MHRERILKWELFKPELQTMDSVFVLPVVSYNFSWTCLSLGSSALKAHGVT